MKEKEILKMVELLESWKNKVAEAKGKIEMLEEELWRDFKIKPNKIDEKIKEFTKKKKDAERKANKAIKRFRNSWKDEFGEEECPI